MAMPQSTTITRRELLRFGMSGVLGLSLPQLLALQARATTSPNARAKRVLVLLEQGGMSQMDTWDPKPEVVADQRSPYKPIATSVPGIRFTELLTQTSRVAHKLAVVRSMYHPKGGASGHGEGTQYMLSGAHPASAIHMPDMGSVVSHVLGTQCKDLPHYIMVPGNNEQNAVTSTGFLPSATKVFKTGGYDVAAPNWTVADLKPLGENSGDRLGNRRRLLDAVESGQPLGPGRLEVQGLDRFYQQSFETLMSSKVAKAFDIRGEPATVRDRYGAGHRGACYLLGRKLMEADVRFVTVDVRWPLSPDTPGGFNLNWDHHDAIYASGSCGTVRDKAGGEGRYGIGTWVMMGSVDRAFAALIDDMEVRGLLDETLICFVTEFGRTPRLNQFQGRDHWTNAYSIVLAGAGVAGGQIIGATDKEGGQVVAEPHTPEDYAATVYEKLGLDRTRPLYTSTNRPVFFGHDGDPIAALF
jgi:hypothetical protein